MYGTTCDHSDEPTCASTQADSSEYSSEYGSAALGRGLKYRTHVRAAAPTILQPKHMGRPGEGGTRVGRTELIARIRKWYVRPGSSPCTCRRRAHQSQEGGRAGRWVGAVESARQRSGETSVSSRGPSYTTTKCLRLSSSISTTVLSTAAPLPELRSAQQTTARRRCTARAAQPHRRGRSALPERPKSE
jgi:hypothetical protein